MLGDVLQKFILPTCFQSHFDVINADCHATVGRARLFPCVQKIHNIIIVLMGALRRGFRLSWVKDNVSKHIPAANSTWRKVAENVAP